MYKRQVEDNGTGFDPKHAKKIFKPFERLVGHSEVEGSGFGLATVSRLLTQHDGSITAKGIPGVGARFVLDLPVCEE